WWREAISKGLKAALTHQNPKWATALWRWWISRPDTVSCFAQYLGDSETWLAESAPASIPDALLDAVTQLCKEHEWPVLLSRALGSQRPIVDCTHRIRSNLAH